MNTIVDADALVGLFNTGDAHNREASRIFEEIVRRGINTLVLPTTIGELAAVFTKDIGMKEAQEVVHRALNSDISILEVDGYLTM
jgi:predicted nucleic acid-binding protein